MKNKWMLITALALGISALMLLNGTYTLAQGPVNTHPRAALYVDNQWHVIPPDTRLWYTFDLNEIRLPVEIILYDGQTKRLLFNVYTSDQIGTGSIGNPIGRAGSPPRSTDLVWRGAFSGRGTIFIEVINPTSTAQPFLLEVSGPSFIPRAQLPAPTPLATPTAPSSTIDVLQLLTFPAIATLRAPLTPLPTATPTRGALVLPTLTLTPTPQTIVIVIVPATATPIPTPLEPPTPIPIVNDWWLNAFYVVNNRTYTIPENAERWFAFDYAGDRSKVEIRIPGGNELKLQFRLYTLEQVLRYPAEIAPTGVGTAPRDSNDLVWAGSFPFRGKFFIQVVNPEPATKQYQIQVIGGSVTLGQ